VACIGKRAASRSLSSASSSSSNDSSSVRVPILGSSSSSSDSNDEKEKELKKERKSIKQLTWFTKRFVKKKSVSVENLKQFHATLGEAKKELKEGSCSSNKQKLPNQSI
jgi:hypothetical protein